MNTFALIAAALLQYDPGAFPVALPTTSPVMILTVKRRTGKIIRQSIPAGTRIPCDTPIYVQYQ